MIKNFIKRAYATQMTYEVSNAEKVEAERALLYFNSSSKLLDKASNHLDLINTPFKDNQTISPDDIFKARAALRRFRDKSIDNFNDFKVIAFKCVNVMQIFTSDTQTLKLIKSFVSSINDLEVSVNNFVNLFNDLESKDFQANIVKSITSIKKQITELSEIIEQRVKTHIQSNILAKNWVDSVSDDLQMQIQKRTPLIIDLVNERENQLNSLNKK